MHKTRLNIFFGCPIGNFLDRWKDVYKKIKYIKYIQLFKISNTLRSFEGLFTILGLFQLANRTPDMYVYTIQSLYTYGHLYRRVHIWSLVREMVIPISLVWIHPWRGVLVSGGGKIGRGSNIQQTLLRTYNICPFFIKSV